MRSTFLRAGAFGSMVVLVGLGPSAPPSERPTPSAASGAQDSILKALEVQVLLDRAGFSPGVLDGRDGQNTATAIYQFQAAHDLSPSGSADARTVAALRTAVGGDSVQAFVHVVLTDDDVAGPFASVPDDVYAQAEMDRLPYESVVEKLSERFHVDPRALRHLNPGVTLEKVAAGDRIRVPAVVGARVERAAPIAEIRVSADGRFLQALDADGTTLYHFPATLGSAFDPSPEGVFSVESVTRDPWWHYQPAILADVPDHEPDAHIPPGPNNAVGTVWIELSEPHYGIHGTDEPSTVGQASSAGCVRLTNWDVEFLAERLRPGTPVVFLPREGEDARGR